MEYRVERAELCDTAYGYLAPALERDPFLGMPELAMQLRQGKGALFNIYHDQDHVASFTLAVNQLADGTEEVEITAGGGKTNGPDLTYVCVQFARQVAIDAGIDIVRTATRKAGVGRLLARYGMELDEYIYRMRVNDEQQ